MYVFLVMSREQMFGKYRIRWASKHINCYSHVVFAFEWLAVILWSFTLVNVKHSSVYLLQQIIYNLVLTKELVLFIILLIHHNQPRLQDGNGRYVIRKDAKRASSWADIDLFHVDVVVEVLGGKKNFLNKAHHKVRLLRRLCSLRLLGSQRWEVV